MAAKSEQILKGIFAFVILITLPLSQIARVSFNEISLTLSDISIAALFIIFLISRKKIKGALLKPIIIFVLAITLSLLVNLGSLSRDQSLISYSYTLRWVLYASVYLVVINFGPESKKKVIWFLKVSGFCIVFLGFLQYILYPNLRNLYYAGWDEHLYRMFTWTFLDPNFAGAFFVLFSIFLWRFSNLKRPLRFFLTLIPFLAIFLTFSRSAFIMLLTSGIIYSFLVKEKKLALILISIIFLSLMTVTILPFKSEGTNLLRTASGEARIDSMKNAISIFKDHPIFGVGFDAYRYAQRRYGFIDESKMLIHSAAGSENSFLFLLATGGLIGFFLFIYLIYKIMLIKDPLVKASLAGLIINSFFINSLFYPPILLWLWTIIGLNENN